MIDTKELNELRDLADNGLRVLSNADLVKLLNVHAAYDRAEATINLLEADDDGSVEPGAMGMYTDASWRVHAYRRDISNLLTDAVHYGYLLEKLLDEDTKKSVAGATATDK